MWGLLHKIFDIIKNQKKNFFGIIRSYLPAQNLLERWGSTKSFSNSLWPKQTGYIHYAALFYKLVLFTNQYRARRGTLVLPGFLLTSVG